MPAGTHVSTELLHWTQPTTYELEFVKCALEVACDILTHGHIGNLIDELKDTLECFPTALDVLQGALTIKRVQLPVRNARRRAENFEVRRHFGHADECQ